MIYLTQIVNNLLATKCLNFTNIQIERGICIPCPLPPGRQCSVPRFGDETPQFSFRVIPERHLCRGRGSAGHARVTYQGEGLLIGMKG